MLWGYRVKTYPARYLVTALDERKEALLRVSNGQMTGAVMIGTWDHWPTSAAGPPHWAILIRGCPNGPPWQAPCAAVDERRPKESEIRTVPHLRV